MDFKALTKRKPVGAGGLAFSAFSHCISSRRAWIHGEGQFFKNCVSGYYLYRVLKIMGLSGLSQKIFID